MFRITNFGLENSKKKVLSVMGCEQFELGDEINKILDYNKDNSVAHVTVEFTTGVPPYKAYVSMPNRLVVNFPEVVNIVTLSFFKDNENISIAEIIRDNTVNKRRLLR